MPAPLSVWESVELLGRTELAAVGGRLLTLPLDEARREGTDLLARLRFLNGKPRNSRPKIIEDWSLDESALEVGHWTLP